MLNGFHFSETMAGTWRREGSTEEHAMSFTLTARAKSWLKHLRDHKAVIDGNVRIDGLASNAPISGELTINPVLGKLIRYEFGFVADDGKAYRFRGQKDVSITSVVHTMTTLPGTIVDASDRTVGTALLKFDKRDLPGFLASFRPGG